MSLLKRNLKWRKGDEVPLMEQSNEKTLSDDVMFSNPPVSDDDEDEDEKPFKKQDITLWLSDAIVLVIEHLQYYALLLALSEHWGWPIDWVNSTAFTFIFNFDIWEFRKVETGAFNHSRTSFITSKTMGFNYISYLAAWAVILCLLGGIFSGIYFRWMRKRPLYLLLYIARWKRVMFLAIQFLSIPFGVAAARVFHCRKGVTTGNDVMDVQNEFDCYSGAHIGLIALVALIFLVLFLVYPFILSRWVQEQVFSNDPSRHEGYLQLKEAEYEQGLDILWDIGQYHLFSSYRRFWIHYNPLKFIFKFLVIIGFAISIESAFWSSAGLTILFLLAFFALIFKRPYRVRCFNFMIIISHFIISANALIGNFMVRPPWEDPEKFQIVSFLRYPTILHILVAFNVSWLIVLFLWVIYLILLNNSILSKERIWPRLSYDSSNKIGEDTKKYLKAALKARHTLERSLSAISLFAPIHEISHQVKIINAYCREAEYIGDPTHDTLWDLLDELIEAHNALAPVSVFGMSGKNSIKETSEEFIKLMPSFRKRLKQREFDFILVPPLKRRLLLKMYILSVFIGNKRKKISPEEEVTTKLQEALAMFDTRSFDDYDTGFSSKSPTLSDTPSQLLSSRSVSELRSRAETAGFILELEKFALDHPRSKSKQSTSNNTPISIESLNSPSSRKSTVTATPERKQSPHQSSFSLGDDIEKTKSDPSVSHVQQQQQLGGNRSRRNTAPVTSLKGFKFDLTPQRPETAPHSSTDTRTVTIPEKSHESLESHISSNLSLYTPDHPSSIYKASSHEKTPHRPGSAPISRSLPKLPEKLTRPGTVPHFSSRSHTQPVMSSNLSIPGQIEEEDEEAETRHSTTTLQ